MMVIVHVRNVCKILFRKPERVRQLVRLSQENNSKMGYREIIWEGVNWIHLAQNRDK
jgi:hypothetical protein